MVLSFFTCITVIVLSFSNLINHETINAAGNGRTYVKYTYATNKQTEYELPALSVLDNDGINNRAALLPDDRENSQLEKLLVRIDFSGSSGTGFIIGDHEIMTAGHVVSNFNGERPKIIIPKSNPFTNNNVIYLTAVATSIPKDYYTNRFEKDYAIVTVKEDLSSYGKVFLGLGVNESKLIKNNVYALGYKGNAQKISSGKIEEISDYVYSTSVHIYPGTSGGPFYCQYQFGVPGSTDPDEKVQTYKTVIGIVSNCDSLKDDPYITATSRMMRITPEILQFAYNNSNL